jgi:hypothetical protein
MAIYMTPEDGAYKSGIIIKPWKILKGWISDHFMDTSISSSRSNIKAVAGL